MKCAYFTDFYLTFLFVFFASFAQKQTEFNSRQFPSLWITYDSHCSSSTNTYSIKKTTTPRLWCCFPARFRFPLTVDSTYLPTYPNDNLQHIHNNLAGRNTRESVQHGRLKLIICIWSYTRRKMQSDRALGKSSSKIFLWSFHTKVIRDDIFVQKIYQRLSFRI